MICNRELPPTSFSSSSSSSSSSSDVDDGPTMTQPTAGLGKVTP